VVKATLLVVLAASMVVFVIGLVGPFFKIQLGNVSALALMAASVVLDILSSIIGEMVQASINRQRAAALEQACTSSD
jgi:LytS/YehU family sensor histidine kinase